jgi:hypothetical protein
MAGLTEHLTRIEYTLGDIVETKRIYIIKN